MSSKKHQVTSFQSQMSSLHFSNSNEYRLRCLNPLKLQVNYLKNTQIKCPTENMVTSMYQGKFYVMVDYE